MTKHKKIFSKENVMQFIHDKMCADRDYIPLIQELPLITFHFFMSHLAQYEKEVCLHLKKNCNLLFFILLACEEEAKT